MKASIYQNDKGKWVGALSHGKKPDGKRNRIVKYADSEKEIERIMNTIIYEIEHGEYTESNKDSLIGFLKQYHNICAGYDMWNPDAISPDNPKWEETTASLNKMYIDVHFEPYFGDKKIIDIKPMTLDTFYNFKLTNSREIEIMVKGKLEKKNIPPLNINTVIKLNKFLKSAFNYAVKNDLIKKNPTNGVKLGSKEEYHPTVYDEKQFLQLLAKVVETDDEIPIVLGAGCGFRRGEIFGLRWKDINFKDNMITIEKTAVRFDKNIDKNKAKNKTSQRTIVVPEYVIKTLERFRDEKDSINPNDKIITKWMAGSYSGRFKKLLKESGMPHIRLHDLRHYNAVVMMNKGIPDKVAAERLGHADVQMLHKVYQHVLKDMDEKAADGINEMFKKDK